MSESLRPAGDEVHQRRSASTFIFVISVWHDTRASTEKLIILYFPFAAGGITPKPNISICLRLVRVVRRMANPKAKILQVWILARCLLSSGLTFHTASGNQGQEMDANAV